MKWLLPALLILTISCDDTKLRAWPNESEMIYREGNLYYKIDDVYVPNRFPSPCISSCIIVDEEARCDGRQQCHAIRFRGVPSEGIISTFFQIMDSSPGSITINGGARFLFLAMYLYSRRGWSRARIYMLFKEMMVDLDIKKRKFLEEWFDVTCKQDGNRSYGTGNHDGRGM